MDEVVCLVVGHRQAAAINAEEDDETGQPETLIAIDQPVIAHKRMRERGCFRREIGIGAYATDNRLRPRHRGLDHSRVTHLDITDRAHGDVEHIFRSEVEHDYSARRRMASA